MVVTASIYSAKKHWRGRDRGSGFLLSKNSKRSNYVVLCDLAGSFPTSVDITW